MNLFVKHYVKEVKPRFISKYTDDLGQSEIMQNGTIRFPTIRLQKQYIF